MQTLEEYCRINKYTTTACRKTLAVHKILKLALTNSHVLGRAYTTTERPIQSQDIADSKQQSWLDLTKLALWSCTTLRIIAYTGN